MMLDDKNFTKYLNRHEIDAAVQSIANRINADYEGKQVVLVGVLKGAIVFMADLVRHLKVDVEVEFVRLSSYGKARTSSGTVTIIKDIQADIRGKHVLIIEEIIDSGRTLKFLFERLKQSGPASVEIVTLLDKASKRIVDVPVKYVGRSIDDQFLVGYGLDLEERCRNLPDIYYLKYPNCSRLTAVAEPISRRRSLVRRVLARVFFSGPRSYDYRRAICRRRQNVCGEILNSAVLCIQISLESIVSSPQQIIRQKILSSVENFGTEHCSFSSSANETDGTFSST
jgi:hypoxanthine phosphoribosyltransferase